MISAKALMRRSMACVATIPKRSHVFNSFYITVPEMPENHVPNVGLMPVLNKFPKFCDLKSLRTYFDMGKACIDFEEEVASLASKIEEFSNDVSLDEVIEELNKFKLYLQTMEGLLTTLHLVHHPDFTGNMRKLLSTRFQQAYQFLHDSDILYHYFQKMQENDQLTPQEKKLISRYILRSQNQGAHLNPLNRYHYVRQTARMDTFVKQYLLYLDVQNAAYAKEITDPQDMEEFPPNVKNLMCDFDINPKTGPWAITMNEILLDNFFKYCSNPQLRSAVWISMVSRATAYTNPKYRNSSNIEDIRGHRRLLANLGCGKDYQTDIYLASTMGGSCSNIIEVLTAVSENVRPAYEDEVDSLIELASSRGQKKEFEPCDIPYWRRHQLQDLLGVSEHEIMMNFPFEHVWSKTVDFFCKMLAISIKQVELQDKSHVWHQSVRMYEVSDNDGISLGFFYFDPFMRASKNFTLYNDLSFVIIRRGSKYGSVPLSAIIGGLAFQSEDSKHLMSMKNVTGLFAMLSLVMVEMLSTAPYCELRGLSGLPSDARRIPMYFFSNWLRDPKFLKSLSSNCVTNEQIDDGLAKKLVAGRIHLAAHDMSQQMMIAHIDLLMHSTNKFWLDIVREAWKHYQPLPYNTRNHFVCSYPPLVIGSEVCILHANLWSEMIAADLYGAFKECPEEDISALALKYRDTYLKVDGSGDCSEMFAEFRGRDPNFNALSLLNNIPTIN